MSRQIIIVGGGAAGFMAAITAGEAGAPVTLLEKSRACLGKVKISGGGRCNVTHACFDPREFATRYPRGESEMIGPLQRFGARETVAWFAARGVELKTEPDGRMFPVTDSSQTIIDCLISAAKAAGVHLRTGCDVERALPKPDGQFEVIASSHSPLPRFSGERIKVRGTGGDVDTTNPHPDPLPFEKGEEKNGVSNLLCDRLLLATGGTREASGAQLAAALGHTVEPAVPSLFTFRLDAAWLRGLAGVSVESVELSAAGLRERGALLVTHTGLSGPVVLRLSAWGARELHARNYRFPIEINWLPDVDVSAELEKKRLEHGAKLVANTPLAGLPARLWERLVAAPNARWSKFSRTDQHQLTQRLTRTELLVTGKSLNKEEFVTCGGVRLREVNFKTMESRVCPGLYLAGELLDIDGITGGFNFQAAWTTGWLAGKAMV